MNDIILNDLPISGDFIVRSATTGTVLHDTHIDGGDVMPDLAIRPVDWIYIENGTVTITVK